MPVPAGQPFRGLLNLVNGLGIFYSTYAARTHASAAAGMHTAVASMHTVELSGRKLAQKIYPSRARRARARLTVYPPWIQIIDVFAASSQSCDRKSKIGLRHAIKFDLLYCMTKP